MMHLVAPQYEDAVKHEVLRLGSGVLLGMVCDVMDAAAAGHDADSAAKLHLYSGHDTTLMPLLAVLGAPCEDWPPYLSNIIFELYEEQQGQGQGQARAGSGAGGRPAPPQHYVRVYYNTEELAIPGAAPGQPCPLPTFKQAVLGRYLLSREERLRECTVEFTHEDAEPHAVDVKTGSSVV